MIGVESLERIIKAALFTTRLEGEQPLSMMIIASVGAGKSSILSKFIKDGTIHNGILYATDITPFALHKKHGADLKAGRIKVIMIPDLLNMLNKSKDQSDAFITFMNSLIEEGLARVESAQSSFYAEFPVQCSLLTAISKQDFDARRKKWSSLGFLSRTLPISYGYGKATVDNIFRSIMQREYSGSHKITLELPETTLVQMPVEIAAQGLQIAKTVKDDSDLYGFRRFKQIQTLLQGMALSQGRHIVGTEDIAELWELKEFIGYDCSKQL